MEPDRATGALDDYRWLVSDEARRWLDRDPDPEATPLRLAAELRRHMSPPRAHLLLQQMELRRRASKTRKFPQADRMFFTPRLLEQSTSRAVASYKARRFAAAARAVDLCCGIGGDLLALAEHCSVVGVDRDDIAALLADANCRALGRTRARVITADVTEFPVDDFPAWHVDPDRRPTGRRTTRPEYYEPNLDCMDRLLARAGTAAIKLAPAAEVPRRWADEAELEWIGEDRECKQQVAWFGEFARQPGTRAATVLRDSAPQSATIEGQPNDDAVPRAAAIGRYVYEPHATVLAAGLVNVLAERHGLESISPDLGYLTCDTHVEEPTVTVFEVVDVLPLDVRRVKASLRGLQVGRLDIKKRGVDVEPRRLRQQLRVPGDRKRTLLLTRFQSKSVAILAKPSDFVAED
jgi:hypothetical protein